MSEECSPRIPSPEALRELAASRGVHPTNADLDAVTGFLRSILPALDELERAIPPSTPPAGLPARAHEDA